MTSWTALFFRWLALAILFGLILGGTPWNFPDHGRILLQLIREK